MGFVLAILTAAGFWIATYITFTGKPVLRFAADRPPWLLFHPAGVAGDRRLGLENLQSTYTGWTDGKMNFRFSISDLRLARAARSLLVIFITSSILILAAARLRGAGRHGACRAAVREARLRRAAGQSVGVMVWADRGVKIDWPGVQVMLATLVQDKLAKSGAEEVKGSTYPVLAESIVRYQRDHPGIEAVPITETAPKARRLSSDLHRDRIALDALGHVAPDVSRQRRGSAQSRRGRSRPHREGRVRGRATSTRSTRPRARRKAC